MSDQVTEADLQAFVDGELPRERLREVLVHLGSYPDEIPRIAWYIVQKEELRRQVEAAWTGAHPKTAELERQLAQRLRHSRLTPWLQRSAAVALLLTIGWWGHTLFEEHLGVRLPPVVVEAAQAHQVFATDPQRPVEITATATADMVRWFSHHLGKPVRIPSLEEVGLRLIGGRLLSAEDGPAAQLIYEDKSGRRLTLCLSSEPNEVGPEVQIAEVDGLTAGYWQDDDLTYALVADTSEAQLAAIASELGGRPDGVL
jgi:anti-sigma factor RsiW